MNNTPIILAGVLTCLNLVYVAWKIFTGRTEPLNVASWSMFSTIQVIILASSISTGEPYLYSLGLTIGTILVFAACLRYGKQNWDITATLSAFGAFAALVVRFNTTGNGGVIAGVTALNVAGIPWIIQMWKNPDRGVNWMFVITIISGALTLYGIGLPWTIGGSLFPTAGIVYNLILLVFSFRGFMDDEDQILGSTTTEREPHAASIDEDYP